MSFELFPKEKRKRTLTAADKKRIAANQRWKCKACGRTLLARFHVDHIKRFSEGGSDRESNLQALCSNCHDEKNEQERHITKQRRIKENERQDPGVFGGNIFGSLPKPGKSISVLGGLEIPPQRKLKSNIPTLFEGSELSIIGSPKKKRRSKGALDFGF